MATPSRPALPPTTNTLTAHQRSLLLRKSRKIEQLLGSAPYLADPLDNDEQNHATSKVTGAHRRRKASFEPTLSSSSCLPHEHPISVIRRKRHRRSAITSGSISSSSWAQDNDIPMLRIALESLSLELVSAPPSFASLASRASAPLSQETEFLNTSTDQEVYSKQPHEAGLLPRLQPVRFGKLKHDDTWMADGERAIFSVGAGSHCDLHTASDLGATSAGDPTTHLSTVTARCIRKAKMDRLRKKLGIHIPPELVFPDECNSPHKQSRPSDDTPSISFLLSSPLLSASLQQKIATPSEPYVSESNDVQELPVNAPNSSMPTAFSLPPPPRPRKSPKRASPSTKRGHRRRPIRSAEVPPPLPNINNIDLKPLKEKLSLILEIPEETAYGPLARVDESPTSSRPSTAGSQFSSNGGWGASTAPTTPTGSTTSWSSSINSRPTTPKKRPASYRKAPPPITPELLAALNQTVLPSYHP